MPTLKKNFAKKSHQVLHFCQGKSDFKHENVLIFISKGFNQGLYHKKKKKGFNRGRIITYKLKQQFDIDLLSETRHRSLGG